MPFNRIISRMIGHVRAPYGHARELLDYAATMGAGLNYEKKTKDANGIYTVIEYTRPDGTLFLRSTLSNLVSGNYTTVTKQFFGTNGTTVVATDVYTVSYDADGVPYKEVKS